MDDKFLLGKGDNPVYINYSKLNRHGFITGATGSGKTVTLKLISENLSKAGIPVFLSDIKGDLASLSQKGEINEAISKRIDHNGLDDYEPREFPVEFFDVFAKKGIPVRTTISQMGPILLSRLMGLNETQEGILNICFKLADENSWLIIDIKDLRTMLNYLGDHASDLSQYYGNISKASIGAILRSLLVLEEQGGDQFFGEPSFDISDFIRLDQEKMGYINILSSEELFNYPMLYSTFLLWLLSELYERLPEVGDLEKPKIVFFFDEAHLLFDKKNKLVTEKIELIARLIRSKGVGVFFVTQKPTDIPDSIISQCGNRIQHTLRAYTPKEQKDVKSVADGFRQKEGQDLVEEILNLKTGEAVVSVLDEDSKPTIAEKILISPPESKIGTVDPSIRLNIINNSSLFDKYSDSIDRESAYEILSQKRLDDQEKEQERLKAEAEEKIRAKEEAQAQKEAEKLAKERAKQEEKLSQAKAKKKTGYIDRVANNILGTIGREIGRQISRGIFGNKKR